ncbi:MAG: hypothetical protein PVJ52_02575 [Candidatus Woesebacteria bacterium]|jgi:hypothetical protein
MIDLLFPDSPETFWLIAKYAVLLLLSFYLIFAYVVVMQVRLMNETLEVGLEKTIQAIAYLQFAFAVVVIILAVFIL